MQKIGVSLPHDCSRTTSETKLTKNNNSNSSLTIREQSFCSMKGMKGIDPGSRMATYFRNWKKKKASEADNITALNVSPKLLLKRELFSKDLNQSFRHRADILMHRTSQNDYLSRAQSSFLTASIFPRQILISIHFSVAINVSDVIKMQNRNSSVFGAAKLFNKTDFSGHPEINKPQLLHSILTALKLKISECYLWWHDLTRGAPIRY